MDFIEAVIYTSTRGIELLCSRLIMLGVSGFVIEDSEDFMEFLNDTKPHWDYVDDELMELKDQESKIKIYLTCDSQGRALLGEVREEVHAIRANDASQEYGRLEIELKNVRQEDWDNNWKQYFKPFDLGDKLTIKPSWEVCDKREGRIVLEIDPGSSFGTGAHHTTKLCLLALEKEVGGGERVLDMGCGSGILGIAAILFGAKYVTAVDIDRHSAKTAYENAKKNNIDPAQFEAHYGNVLSDNKLSDGLSAMPYDIVVANIVADVIIAMGEKLFSFVAPGGALIVSGIIGERSDEVERALLSAGFTFDRIEEQNDWRAIVMRKALAC